VQLSYYAVGWQPISRLGHLW